MTVLTAMIVQKKFTWPDFGRVYIPMYPLSIATPLLLDSSDPIHFGPKIHVRDTLFRVLMCFKRFDHRDTQTLDRNYRLSSSSQPPMICFTDVFFCFFCFAFSVRHKNTTQPFSGTAERIFMKLLPNDSGENGVCSPYPNGG